MHSNVFVQANYIKVIGSGVESPVVSWSSALRGSSSCTKVKPTPVYRGPITSRGRTVTHSENSEEAQSELEKQTVVWI